MKVGVIDYGVGNLGSVLRALEELRFTAVLVTRAIDLHLVDCMILPGVGNFGDCSKVLYANGWAEAIREEVLGYRTPLLGICLGMQLLADHSFEGADADGNPSSGLGLVAGEVRHLRSLGTSLRTPHVGWNAVRTPGRQDVLFSGLPDGTDFYFVHSYGFVAEDAKDVIAFVDYGTEITAAVRRDNVWGTQFHPEKSSRAGFHLLRNFLEGQRC